MAEEKQEFKGEVELYYAIAEEEGDGKGKTTIIPMLITKDGKEVLKIDAKGNVFVEGKNIYDYPEDATHIFNNPNGEFLKIDAEKNIHCSGKVWSGEELAKALTPDMSWAGKPEAGTINTAYGILKHLKEDK